MDDQQLSARTDWELREQLRRSQEKVEQLEAALDSRHVFGLAQGMLMHRYGLDEQRAFQYIARRSNVENVKAVEIARRLITELSSGDSSP